jgi:hypothetical protein
MNGSGGDDDAVVAEAADAEPLVLAIIEAWVGAILRQAQDEVFDKLRMRPSW